MTVTDFFKEKVPFLWGLTDDDAKTLAEATQQLSFTAGQAIIRQGVTVDGLHVIAEGKVAVWIKPKGKQPVEVAALGPGDVFGERSVLDFGVAGATIKAVEDCTIFLVPQDTFLKLMQTNPALRELFMAKIEARRKPLSGNPPIHEPPPEKPA
ncbi:MAG: cyclic nucleotide-binding domain-containing protein [Elusimicrobia bacterium]|nr:cyclic nucleotide-binding domain-containing protein [Elusimicrobiota bacterium]